MHRGVDYGARIGTPIRAAASGIVIKAARGRGYGRYIAIAHNNIYSTLYAHMHSFKSGLRVGSYVKQGQTIGLVPIF